MAKRGEQINWEDGNKVGAITSTTWSTKGTEDRLAKAREDLRRAGFEREAGLLNNGRLNGAWYKVPEADRQKYLAARVGDNVNKRPRSKTAEKDSSRLKRMNGESAKFHDSPFFAAVVSPSVFTQSDNLLCRCANEHVCGPKPRPGGWPHRRRRSN